MRRTFTRTLELFYKNTQCSSLQKFQPSIIREHKGAQIYPTYTKPCLFRVRGRKPLDVQSEGTESSAKRTERIFIHTFIDPQLQQSSTHKQKGHTTSASDSICFTGCADCCEFVANFASTMVSTMSSGVFLCVAVIMSFLATSGARLTPSNEGQIAMVTDSEALLAVDRFTDALGHHAHALAFAEFASKYVRRSLCYLVASFLLVLDEFSCLAFACGACTGAGIKGAESRGKLNGFLFSVCAVEIL